MIVQYERLPTFCYWCGLVGHGTNTCLRVPGTGWIRVPLPSRDTRGKTVISDPVTKVVAPIEGLVDSSMSLVDLSLTTKTNFGPWMIVGCWRRQACGRVDGSHPGHVTPSVASPKPNVSPVSQNSASRGVRDRMRTHGRGGSLASRAQRSDDFDDDVTCDPDPIILPNKFNDTLIPEVSQDNNKDGHRESESPQVLVHHLGTLSHDPTFLVPSSQHHIA